MSSAILVPIFFLHMYLHWYVGALLGFWNSIWGVYPQHCTFPLCATYLHVIDLIQRISGSLYLFSFSALTFLQKTFPQANISTAVTNPVINKGIGFLNYMGAWQGRGMLKMTCWSSFLNWIHGICGCLIKALSLC